MEKYLNLFVGTILLSNLYYLSPLVGLSNSSVIIFLIITSFLGFALRFNLSNLKLLGTKLTYRLVLLSIILFVINSFFNYEFYSNDIIRISSYTFYFCWTFSIFHYDKPLLSAHIKKLVGILFVIIFLLSFFEYNYYEIFKFIIDKDFATQDKNRRLAITFMDPNSFAFALISFTYVYNRLTKSSIKNIIVLGVVFILINLTGSRLGLLLLAILIYPRLIEFLLKFNFSKILFVILGLSIFSFVPISLNDDSKTATLTERFFDDEKSKGASASSNQRMESINNGIKAIDLLNVFVPPGNFLFRSKWEKNSSGKHYPHSTLLYMFVEYGVYLIWPLWLLILLYKKAKRARILRIYFISLVGFLLLPNLIYYSTIYFIIFYIEYEYSSFTSVA